MHTLIKGVRKGVRHKLERFDLRRACAYRHMLYAMDHVPHDSGKHCGIQSKTTWKRDASHFIFDEDLSDSFRTPSLYCPAAIMQRMASARAKSAHRFLNSGICNFVPDACTRKMDILRPQRGG